MNRTKTCYVFLHEDDNNVPLPVHIPKMPSQTNAKQNRYTPDEEARYLLSPYIKHGITSDHAEYEYVIHSLATERIHRSALTVFILYTRTHNLGPVRKLQLEHGIGYMEYRSTEVGWKQLQQDSRTLKLVFGWNLPTFATDLPDTGGRAYTKQQIEHIISCQSKRVAFSTIIAADAGLRAHELYTLRRIDEQAPSPHRPWNPHRFTGLDEPRTIYTVKGKGGLIREVSISNPLVEQLESLRLAKPQLVRDREINYSAHYDLTGGARWSQAFSVSCKKALRRSHGAHGLRHSYAQDRMQTLMQRNFIHDDALSIVSNELGHFRPDICLELIS